MQAASIATGSREAKIPTSFITGAPACPLQSQSTLIFFITLIKAIFPLKYLTTLPAASAIDSKNLSCSGNFFQHSTWSLVTPAEWIQAFPAVDATPIESCLSAPPYPPIWWPLKCDKTSIES